MNSELRSSLLRAGALLLASYGLFYFSYKYYVPIRADFYRYYPMYQRPLDFTAATAPFVYRQVSAVITHALYLTGIFYPEDISFKDPDIDQRMFFSALLANYLGLLLAAIVAGRIAELKTGSFSFSLIAGLLCLISFHTQTAVITGLTDGISWFFVAALYLLYLRGARLLFLVLLVLSIFQREIISLVFILLGSFALLLGSGEKRQNVFVLACAGTCFAAYLLLRTVIIAAPGYEFQLSLASVLANVLSPYAVSLRAVVLQGFMSQNVIFIAAAAHAALWLKAREMPREFLVLFFTFVALAAIGLADGIGVNIGRIGGMLSPAFAALAAAALWRLERLAQNAS